jgi:hypothetical protein
MAARRDQPSLARYRWVAQVTITIPDTVPSTKGNFFAVGRETFVSACQLGINPSTAFLVLARGTGGDNVTTKWSAEAVSQRLGIRWNTAKQAIAALIDGGVIHGVAGKHPAYKLDKAGEPVWLPNEIVDGAGEELPPAMKLRQTQDAMTVRLFGELYAEQNLREDGGISRAITYGKYTRERIGQRGANVVWFFKNDGKWMKWKNPATDCHRSEDKERPGKDFFKRINLLESAGLLEWVPYLFEGPAGEPIHPLAWNGSPAEQGLCKACVAAGRSLLTEEQQAWLDLNRSRGWLVAAPAHIAEVTMFGIARLRYRPHTRMTAAWWADYSERCARFTATYKAISSELAKAA